MQDWIVTLITSNWFWMLITLLVSSIAVSIFANVFEKRRHKISRVCNETLAGHNFGYVPYYVAIFSLANAPVMENWLKGLIGLGIALSVIFLAIGWYLARNERVAEVFKRDHNCPSDTATECHQKVSIKGLGKVVGWNVCLFIVSFSVALAVAVSVERIEAQSTDFDPGVNEWFAMHKWEGVPIEVKIKRTKQIIKLPDKNLLTDNRVLIRLKDSRFVVVVPTHNDNKEFIFGYLTARDLRGANFFNALTNELRDFIVTGRLPADTNKVDLDPLPLLLSTGRYSGGYSRYQLADGQGHVIHKGAIKQRGTEIVLVNGAYYLVAVVEVNHIAEAEQAAYAKFAIGQLMPYISVVQR